MLYELSRLIYLLRLVCEIQILPNEVTSVVPMIHYNRKSFIYIRIPTSSGNHGKPGKSLKKVPCMEKSWNLNNQGKIMEFCEII